VDPLYLSWWARQNGGVATFVETAAAINHEMPRYVAERAMKLVSSDVRNPRVLILGVAYKPGVSDVRETPVSELRDHLESLGAEVSWHDPMVPIWEGTNPVDLDWDCDIAILATNQNGLAFSHLIAKGVQILDCTNSITRQPGVVSI
jgi:UDP-N-acetyl-D-glucosamine dehydrogenase